MYVLNLLITRFAVDNILQAPDVGQALEKMLQDDSTASQTYELYGPKNYSTAEIAALVDREINSRRRHINLPKKILKPVAEVLNKALWWPVISADEVEREFIDQKIDPSAKTFKDLGIEPAELSSLTFHYLVCTLFYQNFRALKLILNSWDTEVRHTTISPHRQSVKRGKRGNICMSLMISRRLLLVMGCIHNSMRNCTYAKNT